MRNWSAVWVLCVALAATLLSACQAPASEVQDLGDGHLFRRTRDPVISSPAVADLDGDSQPEIAIGSWDGYFYLMDSALGDLSGWPKHSPRGFFSSPALADLDRDGQLDIVVGSDTGKLYAWHQDGQSVAGFPRDLGYQLWASPTLLPGPRVVIGSLEQVYLLDGQGNDLPGWPQPVKGWPDATAAYAPDLLAVTTLTPGDPSLGWLYAWREDGALLADFPVALSTDSDSSPALADLDSDGQWWIVFGDDGGWLHVVDPSGRERPGFPVRTVGAESGPTPTPHPPGGNIHSIEASPAVADLDGDGRLEIAVGAWDGRMYLWDDSGQLLPGWPVQVGDQIISSAALADLDGDNIADIVVGSKDGNLYGWTLTAEPLRGFPYDLGAPVFSSPWLGDLDGDGMAEVVVGADNGIHLLSGVGPLGPAPWPTFHRDNHRTGSAP
jgi:hypothetical protein